MSQFLLYEPEHPLHARPINFPFWWTELHRSAFMGQVARSRQLLDEGMNVEGNENFAGIYPSPLSVAVAQNHYYVARLLLDRGASPKVSDELGNPIIFLAVRHGNLQMVLDLMEAFGEETNEELRRRARNGSTILHWAAMYNQYDVVATLLEENIFPKNVEDNTGETPFDYAKTQKMYDLLK